MYSAIVFMPLLGAIVAGLFGNRIGARPTELLTSGLLVLSALLSWIVFFDVGYGGGGGRVEIFRWMTSGDLEVDWALRVDTLTAVMLVVVTTISSLVHIYSIGYMHHDLFRPRFFAYLSLFTFFMLMLVTSDNFLQLFFGWEGVGLSSYLLIGFWYQKPSANAAAIKAFIVNRIGDFGFALGIFAIYAVFGSLDYDTVFAAAPAMAERTFTFLWMMEANVITTITLLLFIGAMGKSAQFLLHTWLPDAMEGPTPVSALIHAATMVTAGVFLVARTSPLFEQSATALMVVTIVGATTAVFAASVALVQNDIKRVIAYSTCSQLGYMFAALGVGAYQAGIFHLFTHAFFKALLFLGAGSVIHAMSNEQDMRHMGGIRPQVKTTWLMMMVGTLALTGFPYTAGFFSKDAIIESTYAAGTAVGTYAFWMTLVAALFTSFYSWRLMFLTFHGKTRASNEVLGKAHESPSVMTVPLMLLALGAAFAGIAFAGVFIGGGAGGFWGEAIYTGPENNILAAMGEVPGWVVWSPTFMMAIGFVTAWVFYLVNPSLPVSLARTHVLIYRFLLNKWYFDELYDLIFVRPTKALGRFLWKKGDGWLIDGFGPDGIAARVLDITGRVVRLQTGFVYHYAFAMLIGVASLVTYFMFTGA